jgi:hypothetical protein
MHRHDAIRNPLQRHTLPGGRSYRNRVGLSRVQEDRGPGCNTAPGKSLRELERDVFWLERLKEIGAVPELLAVDRSARAILMSGCGEPISTLNTPQDGKRSLRC